MGVASPVMAKLWKCRLGLHNFVGAPAVLIPTIRSASVVASIALTLILEDCCHVLDRYRSLRTR